MAAYAFYHSILTDWLLLAGPLDGREEAEATGGLLEPRLPPSVAEVRSSGGGDGSGSSLTTKHLLVSSGHGDLRLIADGSAAGERQKCTQEMGCCDASPIILVDVSTRMCPQQPLA